jgi:hypothetical protein
MMETLEAIGAVPKKRCGMSTLTRFETRHGRTFEVETLPSKTAPSKARRREADLFVKVPLPRADAATRAIGSRQSFQKHDLRLIQCGTG